MSHEERGHGAAAGPEAGGHGAGGHGAGGHGAGGHGAGGHGAGGHGAGDGGHDVGRIDVRERGGKGPDGEPQYSDRRLFMQLLAFEVPETASPAAIIGELGAKLVDRKVGAVIYEDANNPRGFAVVTWSTDPEVFVNEVRPAILDLSTPPRLRPEFTMLGRAYSQGHEDDLEFWLVKRPAQMALHPDARWTVWYPLRRNGAFAKLEPREQAGILREHGIIGRAYGAQELAHDIRLACHGLDAHDNEFIIGLVGKDLHPLSHVVQSMRKTRQTAEFISQMGPFFVGHVAFRSPGTIG